MFTENSIGHFVAHLMANGSSAETIRAYRQDLSYCNEWTRDKNGLYDAQLISLDWPTTEGVMAQYLTAHRGTWSAKTTQRRLGTFRAWAAWAGCPFAFLKSYRAPTPAPPQPHPIPEGIDGVKRMIASSSNPRHRALCTLTGLMALRVAEAVAVRPEHFDLDEMTLHVYGKGAKERDVPVSHLAWSHLRKAYEVALKHGTTLCVLTNHGARAALTRHARNAGLSRHVKSHDMRATAATAFYENSHDLRAVQEVLGHADSKTTQIYTGVSMASMRKAMEVS